MKPVLVIYATREGHTRKIAERVGDDVAARGVRTDVVDAAHFPKGLSLEHYSAAIVAASVHGERHEREVVEFVKKRVHELERIPTAFLSVSLSEANAEDPTAPASRRAKAAEDVQRMIDRFLKETGWLPSKIKAVAGALMYSKYNFFLRYIMKSIAARAGGSTDTSHDHIYTNWAALDQFADDVVRSITGVRSSPVQVQ